MDFNSARQKELRAIAGIGEAYSAKIIKGRPYQRKDELVQKGILPQGVYDKVKDRIIARQKRLLQRKSGSGREFRRRG